MYLLVGKLRRKTPVEMKDGRKLVKVSVEHEIARDNGSDLRLEDLFVDPAQAESLELETQVAFDVRVYSRGRDIGVAVNGVIDKKKLVSI